jgi:hypothetical protein
MAKRKNSNPPDAPSPKIQPLPAGTPEKDAAQEVPMSVTPWTVFQAAIKVFPPLKYALAVAGIVSAIAIIKGFGLDLRIAVYGTIIMLVLMTALVVFAALSKSKSPQLRYAALVMMWSFLILVILCAALLFTSAFFDFPKPLPILFGMAGLIEDRLGGPLIQPKDRTGMRSATDINDIPGLLISQILEGKNVDTSSRIYEIALINQSERSVFLQKAQVTYQYRTNDEPLGIGERIYAEKLVTQSSTVIQIPIDTNDQSSRASEEAIHPAVEIPPRGTAGPGRRAVRIQIHYSFQNNQQYHPHVGWNIYYSLSLFDEADREIRVFSKAKWRDPDPFW